jgi:hypothetical protein
MGIKPEAERYFAHAKAERELGLRLDELFDITFRDTRGQLSFWLAAPKNHAMERFGLHQEVLAIYSPHAKTDARVMTAIENVARSPEFKHRVEKVLCLVIHRGKPEDIADILHSQTDRIIVSIEADELQNPNRGSMFLSSRIAAEVGAVDLFGMSSPVTSDKYFFGRDELVQTLMTRSYTRHENSGLFGLRKTGKTSVLFAVQRRLADRPILAEYFDCQNPGIHAARWWQVLENISARCAETLARDHKRTAKIDEGYSRANAGTLFTSNLREILKAGGLEQIVLMFDEVEYITHGLSGALGQHWDEDFVPFWQTLRAAHQETKGGFSFIVAGVNPACVEKSHFGVTPNPIFQLAIPQYLEPLAVESVRSMVRSIGRYAGLRFAEPTYAYLQETYGGHPFLIRIACSELWKSSEREKPDKLTDINLQDLQHLRPRIKVRMAQPIKDILLSLVWWYPEEYDLLQILATGDEEFVRQYMKEKPDSVFQFARYGILKPESGQFAISDVRIFLSEQGDAYKRELSPFTRTDMPPELLPEVPDLVLLGKLFEKRCELEVRLRKALVLYLGVKHNWDPSKMSSAMVKGLKTRSDRKNPAELFVGRSPQEVSQELYTLDLKTIALENWDVFGALFEGNKSRFEMNMDTLNRARRIEAHTKPITQDEALEFDNSYTWLKNRLAKVPM